MPSCYTPAGRNINTDIYNVTDLSLYAPCNTTAPFSMCCAIGPDRGGPDTCLENGLCHNAYYGNKDQTWRESCTDPTWKDPACIKLFLNGTGINATEDTLASSSNVLWDVQVTDCGGGMFCDGDSNSVCCRLGQGSYILNGEQVAFDPNASTSSSSSTSASSTSSSTTSSDASTTATDAAAQATATQPNAETQNSGSGLSTGAKAGIGIGVALAVILILLGIFLFWRKSKKSRQQHHDHREAVPAMQQQGHQQQDYKDASQESSAPNLTNGPASSYYETGVSKPVQQYGELSGDTPEHVRRHELPAR